VSGSSIGPPSEPTTAQRQAARWFARQRARATSRTEQAAFRAWLEAAPENGEAYRQLSELWDFAEKVRAEPGMLTARERALARYPASQNRPPILRIAFWAAAAAVVAGAAAALVLVVQRSAPIQMFRTGVGQTANVGLVDGSRLTLDTDTVVRVRLTAYNRMIYLERGRAYFKVAKDQSRPFIVNAAGHSVRATGTAFEVTAEPQRFEVLLVEGHVRVSTLSIGPSENGAKSIYTDLEPGTRLSVTGSRTWTLTKVDSSRELAWIEGELRFDNKPLGEIVAEMNRYSHRKIVIDDPAIANRLLYGAFMAGDVDQFVHALTDYRIARVRSEDDDVVVLTDP
jgi:transmembrane sensor